MQRILLIEDAVDVQILVKSILSKKYLIHSVSTSDAAQAELRAHKYDLIILDINLPDESGLQLCAKLRLDDKFKSIVIVFLTGKDQLADKILGFSVGADDYITKPLVVSEFSARIEAKMRRLAELNTEQELIQRGAFKINLPYQKVSFSTAAGDSELSLTANEFKLLYYFVTHEEHVLNREQILNEVWGHKVSVSDRTVDTLVYCLRTKLGSMASCVQTVPRLGYRFSQKT